MASETTETGHLAEAAEHADGMPQLDFATFPNQIFWLVVTLLIIYLVLTRVALPRIARVLSDRSNALARDLEQAEALKEQAVAAEAAYNKALSDARAEAGLIVAAARAEIQKDLDAAVAVADVEIAAKAAESEAKIAEIRKGALKNVETIAKTTTSEIIKAVLPGTGNAKAVTAAVKAQMKGS